MNTHGQHVVDTVEVEKHIIQEKVNQVTKHIEVPQFQFLNRVADMPVVVQRQLSMVRKTIEVPQMQVVGETVEIPHFQRTVETLEIQTDLREFGHYVCPPAGTGRKCGGREDLSASSYRIRITHVRVNTRLGSSCNCC